VVNVSCFLFSSVLHKVGRNSVVYRSRTSMVLLCYWPLSITNVSQCIHVI